MKPTRPAVQPPPRWLTLAVNLCVVVALLLVILDSFLSRHWIHLAATMGIVAATVFIAAKLKHRSFGPDPKPRRKSVR